MILSRPRMVLHRNGKRIDNFTSFRVTLTMGLVRYAVINESSGRISRVNVKTVTMIDTSFHCSMVQMFRSMFRSRSVAVRIYVFSGVRLVLWFAVTLIIKVIMKFHVTIERRIAGTKFKRIKYREIHAEHASGTYD